MSSLKERADTVFAIGRWFEESQNIHDIPIILHKGLIAIIVNGCETCDSGIVFGMCSSENQCLLRYCKYGKTHIHISLTDPIEFFNRLDDLNELTRNALCEMGLVLTTLEELFHYWQSVAYGEEYVERVMMMETGSLRSYRENPIEVEAKSFAYSMTEKYLDATYEGKSLKFMRETLFTMRRVSP